MKNIRLILLVALLVIIGIVFTVSSMLHPGSREKLAQEVTNPAKGLIGPILQTEHEMKAAPTVAPHQRPTPQVVQQTQPGAPAKISPIRVYTGKAPDPQPTPLGDYAPYGRLVKCELVNTVDSSSVTTPIIGLVIEDVVWNGKVIIPRQSEVHGIAQVDQTRERIASEGPFTFVLNDPNSPGLGRELVVKGIVLDREEDPEFKTYGITDGSAGLRGMVIQTDKLAEVKMFVATFLSGIGEGLKSTTTNVFGTVQNNPNGNTAGIPGYVINPVAQGSQNVLDLYAQQIMQTIMRDGFFIRVEAGKQFYLYVRQVINLNDAKVGGDPARERVKKQYLEERTEDEKVSESRRQRDREEEERLMRSYQQPYPETQYAPYGVEPQQRFQQPNQVQQPQDFPSTPEPQVSPLPQGNPVPVSNSPSNH